jgi:hypothetical protein
MACVDHVAVLLVVVLQVGPTIVMWGGERDQGPLDDLWLLRASTGSSSSSNTATQGATAAGATGSAGPSTPTAAGTAGGGGGAAAGATGGSTGSGSGNSSAALRWVGVKPKAGPGPRFGHAMAGAPGVSLGVSLVVYGMEGSCQGGSSCWGGRPLDMQKPQAFSAALGTTRCNACMSCDRVHVCMQGHAANQGNITQWGCLYG